MSKRTKNFVDNNWYEIKVSWIDLIVKLEILKDQGKEEETIFRRERRWVFPSTLLEKRRFIIFEKNYKFTKLLVDMCSYSKIEKCKNLSINIYNLVAFLNC